MPTLAAAHRFQQVDKESLQTLTRPGDLGFSHARGYQYQNILSILNVVIVGRGRKYPRVERSVTLGKQRGRAFAPCRAAMNRVSARNRIHAIALRAVASQRVRF